MIGAIADDFTGATDLASNLVRSGHRSVVVTDAGAVPQVEPGSVDAIVVALKSRTAPVELAVEQSLAALAVLHAAGADRIYFKYCSTFDSTPEGNIGPVLDALMDALGTSVTVAVPSFPANGRTVYKQHLFVHGELLQNSPMRYHPITPMTESNVIELLRPQTVNRVAGTDLQDVRRGVEALEAAWYASADGLDSGNKSDRTIFVVDAIDDADLHTIADASSSMPLVSGGSGLALGLPGRHRGMSTAALVPSSAGRAVVLAGSASATTRQQIGHALERMPGLKLDVAALAHDLESELARIVASVATMWDADAAVAPVVYATGPDDPMDTLRADSGVLIERALAELATRLVARGARHLLVAGGETSGAVVAALGVAVLKFGSEISPGVAWVTGDGSDGTTLNLALKSGNFGSVDIFTSAWGQLP